MRRPLGLALLGLLLLLVLDLATARAEPALQPTRAELSERDIDDALGNDWYGVYFRSTKVGWANSETIKTVVGETAVLRTSLIIEIKGAPADSRLSQVQEYDLAPPYSLRQAEFSEIGGGVSNVRSIRSTPTGYEAVIVSGKGERRRPLPGLEYTLA